MCVRGLFVREPCVCEREFRARRWWNRDCVKELCVREFCERVSKLGPSWGPSWAEVGALLAEVDPKLGQCCGHAGGQSANSGPAGRGMEVYRSDRSVGFLPLPSYHASAPLVHGFWQRTAASSTLMLIVLVADHIILSGLCRQQARHLAQMSFPTHATQQFH